MASLEKLDLNLFRLMEALYEERSVTRAAERMFVTPSAVSHSLRRLRRLLDDELFTRGSQGMIPTPRAHDVAKQLRILLPQFGEIVSAPAFDPRNSDRRFTIASLPYLMTTLIPDIAAELTAVAPSARLDVSLLYSSVVDDLDRGTVDVALGNFRRAPQRLVAEELLRDAYVLVVPANLPEASRPMTLETMARLSHIDIVMNPQPFQPDQLFDVRQGLERLVVQPGIAAAEEALLRVGLKRVVSGQAPDSPSAMAMAARTGAVSLVPERAARRFAKTYGLSILETPFPRQFLVIQMLTHTLFGDKPAVRWFRDRIREVVANC